HGEVPAASVLRVVQLVGLELEGGGRELGDRPDLVGSTDDAEVGTADVTQDRRRAGLLLGGHLAHGAQQRPRERHDELVTTGEAVRVINSLESDRKSTRLNSSHVKISYAVFCLKKKKKK